MNKLSVLIPVKNEEGAIVELIERINTHLTTEKISYEIVIVDDHSTDLTVNKIKKLQKKYPIRLHKKKGQPGKAFSILEGAKHCKYEYIAMIDGDLQYPPEALSAMFKLTNEHAMVVANRKDYQASRLRRFGSGVSYLFFEKLLHGFDCDTQSGLKIFRRDIISHIKEEEVTGWTIDMPLLKVVQDVGESIGTYDIEFSERVSGSSKINFLRDGFEIALSSVKLRLKKRKVYQIQADNKTNSIGAGYSYKKKKYITHTSLPHHKTALDTFYPWQKALLLISFITFVASLIYSAKTTLLIVIAILTFIYFVDFIFSFYVLLKSLKSSQELSIDPKEVASLDHKKLPIYSILCPMYKEAEILPHFVSAMKSMDWPKRKLDILLLLEEDDMETLEAARKLKLPKYFRILVVPHSFPKTKPKACNYGFNHAKGEYVVIYDAEDKPDPLQLKKSYIGFNKTDKKTVCLQSKLNYFNTDYSLLTRLFTAEYSLWFDLVLPGLQSVSGPLPLGGTSNHFRSKILRKLHAWDPFNVTEDCDLGIRIFKEGYKTAIIDSTTYEEANSSFRGWLKQRSRWIKGYMQTYLVHVRNPLEFVKSHGYKAFIFHLVIGMRMVFILINPILWIFTLSYFLIYPIVGPAIESLYPPVVFYPAVLLLVFGNFIHFYNYMIGAAKRGQYSIIKFVFLIPLYWAMTSWAALIAFQQLFTKPHYWEKTAHGLHLRDKFNLGSYVNSKIKDVSNNIPSFRPSIGSDLAFIFAIIVSSIINFAYSVYLARETGIEQFGVISFLGSILSVCTIVVYALSKNVTLLTSRYSKANSLPNSSIWKKIYSKSYTVSALITFAWIIFSFPISRYFNIDSVIPSLIFSPVLIFFTLTAINHGFLLSNTMFKNVAFIAFFESIVKFISAYVFISSGNAQYVYASLTISVFVSFVLSDILARRIKSVEAATKTIFSMKSFYASLLTNISIIAFLSLDIFIAKRVLSPVEAGEYALISLIGKMIYVLGSLSSQFVMPIFSRGSTTINGNIINKVLVVTALVSSTVYISFGLLAQYSVPSIFGDNSISVIQYLPLYGIAIVGFTISATIINYHQNKKRYMYPAVGFIFTAILVAALAANNSVLGQFVFSFAVITLAQTLIIFLLHIFRHKFSAVSNNFNDLYDLLFEEDEMNKDAEKKLRILVLNWRDMKHSWAGGAEVYVHELSREWIKNGNSVTIFCGNDGNCLRKEIVDGVQIVRRGGFYTVYVWAAIYYVFRFRNKFDVIVDCENGIPFFTTLYTRIPKVLLIHHVHRDVLKNHLLFPFSQIAIFLESKIMPLLYKNVKIVTVSESSRNDIAMFGLGMFENVQIVHPGIDTTKFVKSDKTKHPSFLYLGRLQHYKNIDIALYAFKRINEMHPNATFTIAGFGEYKNKLVELTNSLGLNDSVSFAGFVSEETKCKLLSESWICLQPSSYEGWGITVIEANASGTPVIASKVRGLVDSVIDGETGILVSARNEQELTRAMNDLVLNTSKRAYLSTRALEWSKNFDWNKSSELFLTVLCDVAGYRISVPDERDLSFTKY